MAEQLGGIPRSEATKLGRVVRQVLGRLPDVGRRTRRLSSGGRSATDSNANVGDGSCACCNPSLCVDYPVPLSGCDACAVSAREWKINFGAMSSTMCETFPGLVRMSHVAYCVYRSETFICEATAAQSGCNGGSATGCDENPNQASGCTGTSSWMGIDDGDGPYWYLVSKTCSSGCYPVAPGDAAVDGVPGTGTCVAVQVAFSQPCIYAPDGSGGWKLSYSRCPCGCTGVDDILIAYGPPGTGPGQYTSATATCDVDGEPVLGEGAQYSWVELDMSMERDSENRNMSIATLYVGGVAAAEWIMPIGKDWCCQCENRMELKCCGPYSFGSVPEFICVSPLDFDDESKYVDVPAGYTGCCVPFLINGVPKLPRYINLPISFSDPTCAADCTDDASGDYILEWDDGVGGWIYRFLAEGGCMVDTTCDDADPCDAHTYTALSHVFIECSSHQFNLTVVGISYSFDSGCDASDCGTIGCFLSTPFNLYAATSATGQGCFTDAGVSFPDPTTGKYKAGTVVAKAVI